MLTFRTVSCEVRLVPTTVNYLRYHHVIFEASGLVGAAAGTSSARSLEMFYVTRSLPN